MNFVDTKAFEVARPLKAAHFDFPRAQVLRQAFVNCVTDYYTKSDIGGLEANGLIITGLSRVGKSQEIKKLISDFNASDTKMPDGRPGRIVSCVLSGRVSWKDLGIQTLNALGFEIRSNRTQVYIWERVIDQAMRQGVIAVHYDECQHVFVEGSKSNRYFLDNFKSMMKHPRWPMMLLLSGVPDLTKFVQPYEQLSNLLRPVHFDEINFKRDMQQLNSLMFAFADKGNVEIEELSTPDFLARLDHACAHRWGLVIELVIDALIRCRLEGRAQISVNDFVEEFASKTGIPNKFSPFTAPDFREVFDASKILDLMT
ncbi:MAG TPA: TniB family NTP-binding protein [Roseovarius sp.]